MFIYLILNLTPQTYSVLNYVLILTGEVRGPSLEFQKLVNRLYRVVLENIWIKKKFCKPFWEFSNFRVLPNYFKRKSLLMIQEQTLRWIL